MASLLLFNKPYRVLCQFRDKDGKSTLADFIDVPGVYPAGRLDYDSEGLLLLTDDGSLQARIAQPRHKMHKVYLVQVEGEADATAVSQLARGVELKDGPAAAVSARRIETPRLWDRDPPIRERRNIPTSWLEITLDEGRNRQVRRMTAAVGLPTLRLVRTRIGDWSIDALEPGAFRTIEVHTPKRRPNRRRG